MEREQRRGGREPARLGDAIEAFLQQSGLSSGLKEQRLFDAWNKALGTTMAAHARPVRYQRGQLWVQVDSAAHLHELQNFTGKRHVARANAILGEERIQRVVFKLAGRP